MNAKRVLYNIAGIESEIEYLTNQVIKTETQLMRVTPILSGMPQGGGDNDKMAAGISDLIKWRNKLKNKVIQLVEAKINAFETIGKIEDNRYRKILIEFYFNKTPLTKISYELGYDYYYTAALHKKALQEFEKHHKTS